MICSDPLVDFLKAQGYCAVRVPRADLRPLQVLAMQDRALERLGELDEVLAAGDVPLPSLERAVPLPTLSGRRTGALSAGVGLSLLDGAFKAMGVQPPSLSASLAPGMTLTLAFDGVTEDRVDVALLDRYLAAADVRPGTPSVAALLDSDDVYVIIAVLRCRRLLVTAHGADKHAASLSVPHVQGVVDASAALTVSREDDTTLAYEGRSPLAFGFKAVRLMYEDGRYAALKRLAAGRVMRGGPAESHAAPLEVTGPFARLR